MRRGRRPHFSIDYLKASFADPGCLNRTLSAVEGAENLDLDERAVVDVIADLTGSDFEKSMRSDRNPLVWQDVYKPVVAGREIYIKFTLDDAGQLLLISFKAN